MKPTILVIFTFYEKYFNPNNAYLVVIGDVDFKTVKKQIKNHFGKWEKSVDVSTSLPDVSPNAQYTQINFVDLPTASQSSITITNNVDLKMNDKDFQNGMGKILDEEQMKKMQTYIPK